MHHYTWRRTFLFFSLTHSAFRWSWAEEAKTCMPQLHCRAALVDLLRMVLVQQLIAALLVNIRVAYIWTRSVGQFATRTSIWNAHCIFACHDRWRSNSLLYWRTQSVGRWDLTVHAIMHASQIDHCTSSEILQNMWTMQENNTARALCTVMRPHFIQQFFIMLYWGVVRIAFRYLKVVSCEIL